MFKLLRYFFISIALASVLIVATTGFLYWQNQNNRIVGHIVSRDVQRVQSFASTIWPKYQNYVNSVLRPDGDALHAKPETLEMHALLKVMKAEYSVVKAKIYNLDGLTVYSSEFSQIGEVIKGDANFDDAVQHKTSAAEIIFYETFLSFDGPIDNRYIIKRYLPVSGAAGGTEAVLELYTDVTQQVEEMHWNMLLVFGSLLLGLGLLSGLLFRIVKRADLVIEEYYADFILKIAEADIETQRASDQLRQAIESISEGFVLHDSDDRLVICNQNYKDFYRSHSDRFEVGAKFEDLLRHGVGRGEFGFPEDSAESWLQERVQHHLNPGDPFEQHLSDGRWLRVSERKTKEGGIVGTRIDITEWKMAEKALQESQQRLSDAIESISEGFVLYDKDDRLVICNNMYKEIYAISAPSMVPGATFEEVIRYGAERGQYAAAQGRLEDFVKERVAKHRSLPEVVEQELSDGRWLRITERKTQNGSTVGIRTDITTQKLAERVLQEQNEDLEKRVEKRTMELKKAMNEAEIANRSKSEFLANMSHELRSPLNAILGFSQMLTNEVCGKLENPKHLEYATDIHTSGSHLLQIISDILDISKIEAGQATLEETEVDVMIAVKNCVTILMSRVDEANITVKTDIEEHLPSLYADERHIKQILINLLTNATKFTPVGGAITVSARLNDHSWLEITVTDTGVGIAADDIPKILQPFGQVAESQTRNHKGTGLGLPICKSLMELHGGVLGIESEVGEGTTATIKFPPERTRLQ